MTDKENQAHIWERALLELAPLDRGPEQQILSFLDQGNNLLGHRGLDIGCGLGRHSLTLLQHRCDVVSVDFSAFAVSATRRLLEVNGYSAPILCARMEMLPFSRGCFDFALAWCVLNHGTKAQFVSALREATRVLKPGGCFLGCIMTRDDERFGRGVRIEEDTFVFRDGPERGICHYFPAVDSIETQLAELGDVEHFEEVCEGTEMAQQYHPGIAKSSHIVFRIRRRQQR